MNMQPSEAEAGYDLRLPPMADPDVMKKRIAEEWAPSIRNMTYTVYMNIKLVKHYFGFFFFRASTLVMNEYLECFVLPNICFSYFNTTIQGYDEMS